MPASALRPLVRLLLALAAALLPAAAAAAQQGGPTATATLYARAEGDVVRAAIEIEIQPGWHLYHTDLGPPDAVGQPTTVTLGPEEIAWSEVRFPEPKELPQPLIGEGGRDTWILGHEGRIVLHAAGRASAELADPAAAVVARIRGLTCLDDGRCIPWRAELEAAGPGPDALFAGFPADLAPPAAAPGGEKAEASEAPEASAAPEPRPAAAEPLPALEIDGPADARLYTRREGELVRGVLELLVEPGWHLYHTELGPPDAVGYPTAVELEPASVAWSPARFPEPVRFDQPVGRNGEPTWILGHEGRVVVTFAGRAPPDAGAVEERVVARVRGLTCEDEGQCVPLEATVPTSGRGPDALFADFPADLAPPASAAGADGAADGAPGAGAGGGAAAGPGPGGAAGTQARAPTGASGAVGGEIDYAAVRFPDFRPRSGLGAEGLEGADRGLLVWLALAFLAGMLLNVMPCVLPVISIKVLSFVQQAGEDRRRVLSLGLAFAGGILVVFVALAALAIGAGQAWGEQFQSSAFLIAMIAVVFGFSLSLFGVYDLGVPSQVGTLATHREGVPDAFFKGMLATVLATPCSGPFLGSTLTWTLAQPALVVLAVFLALGLGMACPYVVLTANPRLLKLLPRPGAWMETFKQAMGFVLLATVVYLMTILRQDLLLYTVVLLGFVALALWVWGRFAPFGAPLGKRLATLAAAALVLAGGAHFSFSTLRGLYTHESDLWEPFDPVRFERYLAEGRSVFLDFTADWCPNCKFNEKTVYDTDEVRAVLDEKGVLAVKADMTHDTPYTEMIERLLRSLGGSAIPYLAIFPGDAPYAPYVKPDVVTKGEILEILETLPDDGRPRPTEFARR